MDKGTRCLIVISLSCHCLIAARRGSEGESGTIRGAFKIGPRIQVQRIARKRPLRAWVRVWCSAVRHSNK